MGIKKINIAVVTIVSTFVFSVIVFSCKRSTITPKEEFNEEPDLTASYDYMSKHNVNSNLATLGRVLFYDRKLSTNNQISCGSCHKQQYAFADNVQFNKGFNGIALKRNSPSIQGIKGFFNNKFNSNTGVMMESNGYPTEENQAPVLLFWDGRQSNVSDMVLNPVLNHKEMNIPDFPTLINKLNGTTYYPSLFKNAFGDEQITTKRIAFALQGFMACLNTTTASPVDKNVSSNNFNNHGFIPSNQTQTTSTLTGIEEIGRQLFHNKYNCAKCHDPDPSNPGGYGVAPAPSAQTMFNIGLDEVYSDNGLGKITGKPGDAGVFKVPTLKNISVTAPYMHDGRFANLGEVIDHYSHGIKSNQNLSSLFVGFDGQPKKLNILPTEKQALIAFLNTLKDEDFLTSPMYSDPFKK